MTDILIDGAPATADDLAHQALVNYGAYTSFRVEAGAVRGLDRHLARLGRAAVELFGEAVPEAQMRELMRQAVQGRDACWLRVSLFSPHIGHRTPSWTGRPRVMTVVSPPPPPLAERMRVTALTHEREAPHLKHVATFGLTLARRRARAAGYDDALFIGRDGRVTEGTLWNIGFLEGDRVVWPEAPMLEGVAQALIQEGLSRVGVGQHTRPVTLADLSAFDGAFACNSATPACPITAIGGLTYPANAPLMSALSSAWLSFTPDAI